jgi:elongation factor G
VPAYKLKAAIRQIISSPENAAKISPILMGASYRNCGVQPLLDSIVSYLPSPIDRSSISSINDEAIKRSPSRA